MLYPSRTSALRREQNSHEGGFAAGRASSGRRAENIGQLERPNSPTGEVRCERDNTKDKGSTAPRNAASRSGCPSCWLAPDASSVKARIPKAPWLVAYPVSKAQYKQRAAPHHQASSAFSRAPMPNPSVKLTRSGMAPGPSSALVHFALHGPGAMPPRSAYLKR